MACKPNRQTQEIGNVSAKLLESKLSSRRIGVVRAIFYTAPGVILKDAENISHDKATCVSDDNNKCMDQCAQEEWGAEEENRSRYGLIFGTDCQAVRHNIYQRCVQRCSKK